ncbi:hypothetical protein KQE47_26665, partial [Raoultella planticola]|uniref:hypothetical protein n=1 Tax=Raoultella planticola TaxID=575 RepID=UPI00247FF347
GLPALEGCVLTGAHEFKEYYWSVRVDLGWGVAKFGLWGLWGPNCLRMAEPCCAMFISLIG